MKKIISGFSYIFIYNEELLIFCTVLENVKLMVSLSDLQQGILLKQIDGKHINNQSYSVIIDRKQILHFCKYYQYN